MAIVESPPALTGSEVAGKSVGAETRSVSTPSRQATVFEKLIAPVIAGTFDLIAGAFPHTVRIETTNACNAKCTVCPHPVMSRPVNRMTPALYEKIVQECGLRGCPEIHLHNFGEPLLDRDIADRIALAKRAGVKKVKIFSNGALITEKISHRLIDAGLDEFKVSFDGATKEEFERIRAPLKYDRVIENLTTLVRIRNERKVKLKISVNCCSTTDKDRTMELLSELVDEFNFARLHNWADGDYAGEPQGVRQPCIRLWRTLTILVTGDVSLCCLDYDGKVKLGRIDEKTSIQDVWKGAGYRAVRTLHRSVRQGEMDLCRTCSKSFVHSPF
jgi:MoaA/NifB/PqqE/SkfB family radical SAM enzyme